MVTSDIQVGRVIRIGRRWVDVMVNQEVRRIWTRPDLLVRAGSYVKIINDQGIALLPSDQRYQANKLH
ncbi:MAG: hypothetical protein JXQ72_02940 [Anaerolineae bacterium]|nr:hypothetical protein [Anaerolineae bacterium]